jgi:hypothetical protein
MFLKFFPLNESNESAPWGSPEVIAKLLLFSKDHKKSQTIGLAFHLRIYES